MAKILTEYIFLTLLVEETVLVMAFQYPCEITNVKGLLIADCSSKNLQGIPVDLDPNIEGLDMGSCGYKHIAMSTFKDYKKLKWLKLTYMSRTKESKFESDTFADMDELEYLDISGSLNHNDLNFVFPSNLKVLKLDDNHFKLLDLRNLTKLEHLSANNNDMEKFPSLCPNAPITELDLRDNPLYDLSVEHIAPYCHLRSLTLKINDLNGIRNPMRFCPCKILEQWLIKWNISSYRLNCTSPGDGVSCDLQFHDDILQLRRECMARIAQEPTKFGWLFMSLIVILMGLVVALSVLYTRSALKRRREKPEVYPRNYSSRRRNYPVIHHEENYHTSEEEHEHEHESEAYEEEEIHEQ